jgi:2'-5' RNA ligase
MLHEPSDASPEPLRLFFAVWPGDEVSATLERQLGGLRSRVRAAWVQPENLHLTLCFLGAVPHIRLNSLITLNFERHLAFELCFDRLRFLRRRRMLWLEPSRPNPVLMDLVKSLEERLDQLGQARDPRPFHAHLTLARNLRGDWSPGERFERLGWHVGGFDLVASVLDRRGARYRRLRHWPLHTTPTGTSVE